MSITELVMPIYLLQSTSVFCSSAVLVIAVMLH